MKTIHDTIEDLLNQALALKPEQRADFLASACGQDNVLRDKVEALLRAYDEAGGFLPEAPNIQYAPVCEGPGSVIGRYKLVKNLGEGGMGVVYLAEQEEPVRRRVALKIIKLGMDTRQVVARFEAERQALAMMDHPNIANIFDAGITGSVVAKASPLASDGGVSPPGPTSGETPEQPTSEDARATVSSGRPYFVMELVQGEPITEFCDKNRLSAEERIKLFIPVCQAIQSAHQKGIIHRDIKPSNVLVTMHHDEPMPKVIDFGIAKATNQKLTEKTIFTNFGTMIGTPAYMSPEQAEMISMDVDTRNDIYSLGVLLYELLTGTTPFPEKRLRSVGYGEMQRIIREEEPERPSTRLKKTVTAGVSRRTETSTNSERRDRKSQIDADLDWIVMKCLEKDRNRRYETANSLVSDIMHFLNDEPVIARPPSTAYRFQKLVRRHRTASVAVACVSLVVVVGVIVSTWALIQERASRVREQAALKQATERLGAALAFIDEVVKQVAPRIENLAGAAGAQESLAQSGLKFVERLRDSAADDPALRVGVARLLLKVSAAQNPGNANSVGNYAVGLKRAQQAAELLATQTPGMNEAEWVELRWWAIFAKVQCLSGLGRWDDGIASSKEMESLLDQLERVPERARWARRQRMNVRVNSGWATMSAGRPLEAIERFFLPVLATDWARTVASNENDSANGDELEILNLVNDNIASAYALLKRYDAMLPYADESVRIAELLVRRFPGNAKWAALRLECWAQQGCALVRVGKVEPGLAALTKGREGIESLVKKDPDNDLFQRYRVVIASFQAVAVAGWSKEGSGSATDRRQRLAKAEAYLAEAEEFFRTVKSKTAMLPAARAEVAAARTKLEAYERAQTKQ